MLRERHWAKHSTQLSVVMRLLTLMLLHRGWQQQTPGSLSVNPPLAPCSYGYGSFERRVARSPDTLRPPASASKQCEHYDDRDTCLFVCINPATTCSLTVCVCVSALSWCPCRVESGVTSENTGGSNVTFAAVSFKKSTERAAFSIYGKQMFLGWMNELSLFTLPF